MFADIYPGLLLLALVDVTPDVALCDMDGCHRTAVVRRGTYRVCLDHAILIPRQAVG